MTQRALKRPSKRQRQRALSHLPELNRPMAEYGLPSMDELERLSQLEQTSMPIGGRLAPMPTNDNTPEPGRSRLRALGANKDTAGQQRPA
jgi:hypothetical protein